MATGSNAAAVTLFDEEPIALLATSASGSSDSANLSVGSSSLNSLAVISSRASPTPEQPSASG